MARLTGTHDRPGAVEAFDRYWASIQPEEHAAYLGALVVFENVARHLGPEIAALIARLRLQKSQSRWLRVHAEADDLHGQHSLALAERYLPADSGSLLQGAERACAPWKEIFRAALEDRVELQAL